MMRTRFFNYALALLLLTCLAAAGQSQSRTRGNDAPLARSRQLVVVTTGDWDARGGTLRRYERRGPRSSWRPVRGPFAVVVGRNGLGWGAGVNSAAGAGPVKKEGDGKAPAGVFRLSSAFGYAPTAEARWLKLPYLPLDSSVECVDDVNSPNYNLILDKDRLKNADWKSSEQMRRDDELYRWGVVVEHNAAPPVSGKGSCIFLHIWQGPESGTAGCTAMERKNLEELLGWLDPKKGPLLVQLPTTEYARLRGSWRLPAATR